MQKLHKIKKGTLGIGQTIGAIIAISIVLVFEGGHEGYLPVSPVCSSHRLITLTMMSPSLNVGTLIKKIQ